MARGLETFPLVAVKHAKTGQRVLIREQDYNPKEHTLFDKADKPAKSEGGSKDDGKKDPHDFSKLDVEQMTAFAVTNKIDLGGAKSKTDVRKVLEAWKEKLPKENA